MRVLVTGGSGFVGSHLCDRLLREGHEVVALDNFVTGARRNLEAIGLSAGRPGLSLCEADLCQGIPVEGRFDRVYHLASPASPIDYVELPFETLYVGSDGTRQALERAHQDGARLLFASTSEIYGDPAVHPQREDYWGNVNPIGPRSVYDEAKRYAEALCMAFHRYKGVELRIIRIFNTYGPRMRAEDGRVVPTFIRQALAGEPLTVFGDGSQTRSFCYVDDLVDGMMRLMESSLETPCNVGNPHELSMLEFANHINRVTDNPGGLLFKPLPTDDPTRRRPDIGLARAALGWEPVVDFAEGIERTIRWFETDGGLGQRPAEASGAAAT
jgi:dTDP-glucose 4,6-dehydratase